MKDKLKAYLVKNRLTTNDGDYIGVVDSRGSVDMEGVIDALIEEGIELKRETLADAIARYNRKCISLALQGYNVGTGLVNMRATIKGSVYYRKWNHEINHVRISVSEAMELRRASIGAEVEIIGEKPNPIAIFSITNLKTGKTDGCVNLNYNFELKGSCIKVSGDDPSCGVYLRNLETDEITKLPEDCIVINQPSRMLLLLCGVPTGAYELRIVTQFSTAYKALNAPRSTTLNHTLTVE